MVPNADLQTELAASQSSEELIKNRSPGPRRCLVEPGNMSFTPNLCDSSVQLGLEAAKPHDPPSPLLL